VIAKQTEIIVATFTEVHSGQFAEEIFRDYVFIASRARAKSLIAVHQEAALNQSPFAPDTFSVNGL
jgi:hypothetical protein